MTNLTSSVDANEILAVIFDVDGTLIDDKPHLEKHRYMLEKNFPDIYERIAENWGELGGLGDRPLYENYILKPAKDMGVEHLLPNYDDYMAGADRYFYDHIHQLKLRDGAMDIIDAVAARNLPRGIGTNGTEEETLRKLDVTGIRDCFMIDPNNQGMLSCVDHVDHPKPAPDIYLDAFWKAKVCTPQLYHSSQMLVIEDTIAGATAGLAAGCQVILWKHAGQNPKLCQPNLTITSDAADIVARIN